MINGKQRKRERLTSGLADTMSARQYNLVIGGCITYGFIINAVIISTFGDFLSSIGTGIFIIGYIVLAVMGIMLTMSRNPIISFIGYNLVVVPLGSALAVCLPYHSTVHIFQAAVVTGIVFLVMTCLATAFPSIFARLGRGLFISLIVLVITQLIGIFLLGYAGTLFSWAGAVIFTLYIGYDWHVAQSYPKTLDNAIDSACDLYIDIVNLFEDILHIMDR